jgi:hypothetical protein
MGAGLGWDDGEARESEGTALLCEQAVCLHVNVRMEGWFLSRFARAAVAWWWALQVVDVCHGARRVGQVGIQHLASSAISINIIITGSRTTPVRGKRAVRQRTRTARRAILLALVSAETLVLTGARLWRMHISNCPQPELNTTRQPVYTALWVKQASVGHRLHAASFRSLSRVPEHMSEPTCTPTIASWSARRQGDCNGVGALNPSRLHISRIILHTGYAIARGGCWCNHWPGRYLDEKKRGRIEAALLCASQSGYVVVSGWGGVWGWEPQRERTGKLLVQP